MSSDGGELGRGHGEEHALIPVKEGMEIDRLQLALRTLVERYPGRTLKIAYLRDDQIAVIVRSGRPLGDFNVG